MFSFGSIQSSAVLGFGTAGSNDKYAQVGGATFPPSPLRVSSVLSTLLQATHSTLQSDLVSSTTVYVTKFCCK